MNASTSFIRAEYHELEPLLWAMIHHKSAEHRIQSAMTLVRFIKTHFKQRAITNEDRNRLGDAFMHSNLIPMQQSVIFQDENTVTISGDFNLKELAKFITW